MPLRIRLLSILLITLAMLGCGAPAGTKLGVDNGTTLAVTVVVNGVNLGTVGPQQQQLFDASAVGSMPWNVQALSPTGRVLVSVFVPAGSVSTTTDADGHTGQSGVGGRVDLSCGRLDVYAGPPMLGPAPGQGVPGDCAP